MVKDRGLQPTTGNWYTTDSTAPWWLVMVNRKKFIALNQEKTWLVARNIPPWFFVPEYASFPGKPWLLRVNQYQGEVHPINFMMTACSPPTVHRWTYGWIVGNAHRTSTNHRLKVMTGGWKWLQKRFMVANLGMVILQNASDFLQNT